MEINDNLIWGDEILVGAEETISEAQDPINDSFDDNFMEVDEIPPPDQLEEPMVEPEIPAPAVQIEPQSPPRGRGEDGRSLRIPIYNARYNAYRRSLLGKVETKLIDEFRVKHSSVLLATAFEPQSWDEAQRSERRDEWNEVFLEEFNSIQKNETYKLVEHLPDGYTAINCKMIGKIKEGYEGVPERLKGRLVAIGCNQKYGIDYEDVFAPVAHQEAIKAVISEIATRGLHIRQIDIKTAFLNAKLDKRIFMKQPKGFVVKGKETWVCELQKSIYGLKQAPRLWFKMLDCRLGSFVHRGQRLKACDADRCIYILRIGNFILIVIAHVDDLFVAASTPEALNAIEKHLFSQFEGRVVPPNRFLGMDITRDEVLGRIHLGQKSMIEKMIDRFGMSNLHPKKIPADPSVHLTKNKRSKDQGECKFPYREAVGALLYLALSTRPDITYAVLQVAKFCEGPDATHVEAVEHIFAYLIATTELGIWLGGDQTNVITGYSDADYARDINDRSSTSGNIFFFRGGPVAWSSRKQKCIATSTTEAEYVSASDATKTALWLRTLHHDLTGDYHQVPLKCDNYGAVRLVKNPENHPKTKHIDVRYHFIRKADEEKKISVEFVGSADQLADIFTKPLSRVKFEEMRSRIGVGSVSD